MPQQLIADSTSSASSVPSVPSAFKRIASLNPTLTSITTNKFGDKKQLCSLCMNWHLTSRAFLICILVLFQSSIITCNHFYGVIGHHRNTNGEESFTVVERERSDGPFLSIQSLRALSLTSLNQLRMHEEKAVPKNVTAQIGHSVYLHCIVEPIGDKMVSWIRLRDFHLLTVGHLTFTSDDRFVIRHGSVPNDWALQINFVTPKDEGLYECQINSDPPRSQYYYVRVVVPFAEMIGFPDMFVRAGAIINLTCIISRSPETPAFVFWYHNDRMINYDYDSSGRVETSLHKDPSKSDTVISRLIIRNAKLHDSGNYTCTPSNAGPTSIYVHVLQGEKRLSNIQNDMGAYELNCSCRRSQTTIYTSACIVVMILIGTLIDLIVVT